MQAGGVNQVTLGQRAGLAVSWVNNYLRGNYRTVRPAHLAGILRALAGTPEDTAALVEAYLFDRFPESRCGFVEIRTPRASKAGKKSVPTKGLPADFADDHGALQARQITSPKIDKYLRAAKTVAGFDSCAVIFQVGAPVALIAVESRRSICQGMIEPRPATVGGDVTPSESRSGHVVDCEVSEGVSGMTAPPPQSPGRSIL